MPDYTTFGGDPIPTGPEGAWVPGSMMAYAEAIDPKLVHTVASQAERDADYATLPAGALVTIPSLKILWLKTASGWQTLAYDSGWVTVGFTYPSSDFAAGNWARARTVNGTTEVRLSVRHTGPDIVTGPAGVIAPDIVVCQIPASFAPISFPLTVRGNMGFTADIYISETGLVTFTGGAPNSTYAYNALMTISATYLAG